MELLWSCCFRSARDARPVEGPAAPGAADGGCVVCGCSRETDGFRRICWCDSCWDVGCVFRDPPAAQSSAAARAPTARGRRNLRGRPRHPAGCMCGACPEDAVTQADIDSPRAPAGMSLARGLAEFGLPPAAPDGSDPGFELPPAAAGDFGEGGARPPEPQRTHSRRPLTLCDEELAQLEPLMATLPPLAAQIIRGFLEEPFVCVLGGLSGQLRDGPLEPVMEVEMFDFSRGQWLGEVSPMPGPRAYFGSCTLRRGSPFGRGFAVAGGCEGMGSSMLEWGTGWCDCNSGHERRCIGVCRRPARSVPLATCQVFDPREGVWTDLPPLLTPRARCALVEVDGQLFCLGGVSKAEGSNEKVPLSSCEVLLPGANSWREVTPMRHALEHAAAVEVAGNIFVAGSRAIAEGGGADPAGHEACVYQSVYSVQLDEWCEVAHPCVARTDFGMLALPDDRVAIVGGLHLHDHFLDEGFPTQNRSTSSCSVTDFSLPCAVCGCTAQPGCSCETCQHAGCTRGAPELHDLLEARASAPRHSELDMPRRSPACVLVGGPDGDTVFVCGGAAGQVYPGFTAVASASLGPLSSLTSRSNQDGLAVDPDEDYIGMGEALDLHGGAGWTEVAPMRSCRQGHAAMLCYM